MTETEKAKTARSVQKIVYVVAYGLAIIVYAFGGALVLDLIFPSLPLILLVVVCGFMGAKMDYRFRGPASKFEQRYVSLKEKDKEPCA